MKLGSELCRFTDFTAYYRTNIRLTDTDDSICNLVGIILEHVLLLLVDFPDRFKIIQVVGVINLYLISILFSVLTLKRGNIWMACGLHFAWNYVLNNVMGLTMSGRESLSDGPLAFGVNGGNLLNGGAYGIEASILTTVVLTLALAGLFGAKRKKGGASLAQEEDI